MFSPDIVAGEAQSAPLLNEMRELQNKRSSREKVVPIGRETFKRKAEAQHSEITDGKRSKAQAKMRVEYTQYTECRLCDLQFQNEYQLEEHICTILHHRALETERGPKYAHECNICKKTVDGLSRYIMHLKSDEHCNNSRARQKAIENGRYTKTRNLKRYSNTFLCRPKRAIRMKKLTNGLVNAPKDSSKQNDLEQSNRIRTNLTVRNGRKHSSSNPGKPVSVDDDQRWRLNSRNYPRAWQDQTYRYGADEANGDWYDYSSEQSQYGRMEGQGYGHHRHQVAYPFYWESRMYSHSISNSRYPEPKNRTPADGYYQNDSLPPEDEFDICPRISLRSREGSHSSHDSSRTKRLIAGARKAINNGRNSRTLADSTTPQSVDRSREKTHAHNDHLPGNARHVVSSVSFSSEVRSVTSQNLLHDDSVSSSTEISSLEQSLADHFGERSKPEQSERTARASANRLSVQTRSRGSSDLSTDNSSVHKSTSQKPRLNRKQEFTTVTSAPSKPQPLTSRNGVSKYEETSLSTPLLNHSTDPKSGAVLICVSSGDSETEVNVDNDPTNSKTEPSSENAIRQKFRKILDEIDQPVASASKILNEEKDFKWPDPNLENDHSGFEAGNTYKDVRKMMDSSQNALRTNSADDIRLSNGRSCNYSNEQFETVKEVKPTLPVDAPPEDQCNSASRIGNTSTDYLNQESTLCSSDNDTLTTKRRINPQPNISKSRSRLISRQGTNASPEISLDVKQAKLRKLLLKYEKTKKSLNSSPDVDTPTRKPQKKNSGPRFGITLNQSNNSTETTDDMLSLAEAGVLEEILPVKRGRSLSENDSSASFTTAATESRLDTPALQEEEQNKSSESLVIKQEMVPAEEQKTENESKILQAKLLSMSEKEEQLHAEVRVLDIEETNTQAKIEKTSNILKQLQATLNSLNERKSCIMNVKGRHENELSNLRQERLRLLRGTQDSAEDFSLSESLFQEVTPVSRWHAPSFSAATCTHSTPTPLDDTLIKTANQNKVPTNLSTYTVASTEISSTVTEVDRNSPGSAPKDSSLFHDNSNTKLRAEPRYEARRNLDSREPFGVQKDARNKIHVKTETDNHGESISAFPMPAEVTASRHPSSVLVSSTEDTYFHTVNDASVESAMAKDQSSEFYSFDVKPPEKITAGGLEVPDLGNARPRSGANTGQSRKTPSSEVLMSLEKVKQNTAKRREDRSIAEYMWASPSVKTPPRSNSSTCLKGNDLLSPNIGSRPNGKSPVRKVFKAHESPLVGLQLVSVGLVTCSTDESVALHGWESGEKISMKLGATPTAVTSFSNRGDVVCLATQKISTVQSGPEQLAFKKLEHHLSVYNINDSMKTGREVFQLACKIQLKGRVFCMHHSKNTLFCGMQDGMVAIITLNERQQLADDIDILECHSYNAVTCLTTGMEGSRPILCCGSTDCTVSVRDARDGLLLRSIQGHTKTVTCVQLDCNELFSAGVDRQVLGHNLNTGQLLHRFLGHPGVVRAFQIVKNCMITLCSDRKIRFFNTKTCKMVEKPKSTPSFPLFVSVKRIGDRGSQRNYTAYVGCEDGTIVQHKIGPSVETGTDCSTISSSDDLAVEFVAETNLKSAATVDLAGDFECEWTACEGVGIYCTKEELLNHVLADHVNVNELTEDSMDRTSATLSIGTCCQWRNCTHYFAPELDTFKDVRAHIERHFET